MPNPADGPRISVSPPFVPAFVQAVVALALLLAGVPAAARADAPAPIPAAAPTPDDVAEAITNGVQILLAMQEGPPGGRNRADPDEAQPNADPDAKPETKTTKPDPKAPSEWPYEGVYRVRGQIPIGYRIGGTSICATALLRAPGYAEDAERKQAVARGLAFVIEGLDHPLMNPDYQGGYDVRGWGYTYALQFILTLLEDDARNAPEGRTAESLRAVAQRLVEAIEQTEIAQVGGWNYARAQGKDAISPPSPFMTGPTLQALFQAKHVGLKVNAEVVNRGLDALELGRTKTGSIVYSGVEGPGSGEPVPGSVGRMLVTETTLELAGRGSVERVRAAIDAFFTHWDWLDARRAKPGTHERPYGVAPYYFFYAHYYAAQAIERLPRRDREEYRRRLAKTLFAVRNDDGGWNDRVFPRSANYGTAMSMMALGMDKAPRPAGWSAVQHSDPRPAP